MRTNALIVVALAGFMGCNCVKVSILLNSKDVDRFDVYRQERGFKKSTLIARLIRDHVDESIFNSQSNEPR